MSNIKYKRPPLYTKQRQAIFNDERIAVVEASTKSGKTYACIAWLVEQALRAEHSGRNYWWVAPVYNQARIAFNRVKRGLPAQLIKVNESDMTVTLFNGSVISFKSAEKPDNLYGEDVWGAVFDEATRAREEAWHALRSTLTATRGPVRIIGNVRGRRNWVYKLARSNAKVSYAKITAFDAAAAGVIDMEEIEAARAELPEQVFNELYLAEPSDDGGNPFSLKHLEACTLAAPPDVIGPIEAYGIDLAKSNDWTVIIGIDNFGYIGEFYRFQDSWEHTKERIIRVIGKRIPTLVDATGVGDPIVEALQAAGCNVEGYVFHTTSKQVLMENLRLRIQLNELTWCEDVLLNELESFEYQYTRSGVKYSAPDGYHDDCVCSLALAARCWQDGRHAFWPYASESYDRVSAERISRTERFRHLKGNYLPDGARPEFMGLRMKEF